MFVGLRLITTTYLYDDPDHPERCTGAIQSPPYTADDRALLMALDAYEASLCRCGQPRSTAWHSEMDGWYEPQTYVCHACTAMAPEDKDGKREPVRYGGPLNTRPADKGPLPPFVLGVTTTSE